MGAKVILVVGVRSGQSICFLFAREEMHSRVRWFRANLSEVYRDHRCEVWCAA